MHNGSLFTLIAQRLMSIKTSPDDAVVKEDKNILVAWPTKLTLVPSLADKVLEHAAEQEKTRQKKAYLPLNCSLYLKDHL